jgi:hypothetical protein
MVALNQEAIVSKTTESMAILASSYLVAEGFNKKW